MSGRTVLLVEDNSTTRKLVRYTLEAKGIEVFEAADGATAIKIAALRPPDVVLQDLMLPDLDGFELIRRLRDTKGMGNAKILAFSGLASRADDARISNAGFDDVITKPIEPSRLVRIVESNFPNQRTGAETFGQGKRVIVADDDPMQQKLTVILLTRAGFDVTGASDGATALELAKATPPDLIVSDVLMPHLDGFGLALAVRRDDRLKHVPVLLMTSSYVESSDRELAKRAGADDLVIRTPNLTELFEAVRSVLKTAAEKPRDPAPDVKVERELSDRIVRQLERHVVLNNKAMQRCTTLAAELRVLRDIAEAVLLGRDLETVLEEVLAACLDAGGIGLGALYLQNPSGRISTYASGSPKSLFTNDDFSSFFGHEAFLRLVIERGTTVSLPAREYDVEGSALLEKLGSNSVLIVPVRIGSARAGALFMAGFGPDLEDSDWRFFAEGVAHQIGLAVALARLVEERETARVRAIEHERISSEHERLLRLILDSTAEGVVVVDKAGEFTLSNKGAARILGKGAIDGRVDSWAEEYGIFKADGTTPCPTDELPIARGMRGESADDIELLVRPTGGAPERWISASLRPVTDVGGKREGAVAVFRDVTERRRAELEVIESRAKWQAVVEHAPDAIVTLAPDGVILFSNRPDGSTNATALVGQSWFDRLTPEHRPVAERALRDVMAAGEPISYEVASRSGEDGALSWYSAHLGPIRKNGKNVGAVVIGQDVTHRKQAEAQLIVSDRMASVGMLAAGVAHEINNPLAAVLTNLELAKEEVARISELVEVRDLSEELADAWTASDRVREIVKDLKIFSRSSEDSHGPVDLKRLIESTSRMAWNEIRHRARLVKTFGDVPPVEANEARLGQVFLNIIVNAAQAIPEGRADGHEIRVTTKVGKIGEAVVEISDTGVGMSPLVQSQLFRPFFTTKGLGVGTGLGLSICHRIVSELGGRIEVRSEEGKGSTFSIVLPAANAPPLRVVEPEPVSKKAERRGRVLVVDDEVAVGTVIKRVIGADHEVVVEHSATAAIERIRRGADFDLILCDVMMPVLSGMEFYGELQRDLPLLAERVVFLTGGAFTERARRFLASVPNRRLDKPFEARSLRELVVDALHTKKR